MYVNNGKILCCQKYNDKLAYYSSRKTKFVSVQRGSLSHATSPVQLFWFKKVAKFFANLQKDDDWNEDFAIEITSDSENFFHFQSLSIDVKNKQTKKAKREGAIHRHLDK